MIVSNCSILYYYLVTRHLLSLSHMKQFFTYSQQMTFPKGAVALKTSVQMMRYATTQIKPPEHSNA